jgi:hypothetical protein
MTTAQYLLFVSPFVVTTLCVFGMKYFSAVFQARARDADEGRYRALAEKAAEMQAEMSAVRAELSKISSSIAAVEKVLQQVE